MVYTVRFFSLQNAVCFIILTYLVPELFTFYIQSVLNCTLCWEKGYHCPQTHGMWGSRRNMGMDPNTDGSDK